MSDENIYLKTKVGPQLNSEGAEALLRSMQDGSLCVTPFRGKYAELALRKKLFFSYSAARATTVVHATNIGNIVWNPPDSGVNLVFYKWAIQIQVTSATTLGITLGYGAQAAAPSGTTVSDAYGSTFLCAASPASGKAKAYSIATISIAPTSVMNLVHNTAAINTVGVDSIQGDLEGMFVIPPGYLAALNAITAAVAAAGMTSTLVWEEIPVY